MARRFFNQKIPNKKKATIQYTIIGVCIVGVIICFVVALKFSNKDKENATIEIRDSVAIEINSDLPDKTTFFKELENVKEEDISVSYDKVDTSKQGEYDVKIKVYKDEYNVKLQVVDTKSPTLKLKDVNIKEGENYVADDFVDSCSDNSEEECEILFYTLATDQEKNPIDYSKYKAAGTYVIQIIAKDTAGNESAPQTANLTIGNTSDTGTSLVCNYGSDKYNTDKYILAAYVTQENCAINPELYRDEPLKVIENLMEQETTKLKKEFSKLNVTGTITLNRKSDAVLNLSETGLVGYTLHMELSVTNNNNTEIIESYYLGVDGKRVYSINKYNLP